MREKLVKIDDDVREVLLEAIAKGETLTLPDQLDRKLYVKVDKVLKALGGKWKRGLGCHVFPGVAGELITEALKRGGAVDEKKTFEAFDTPPDLARELVEMAGVQPGDSALEPSAGRGAIVQALKDAGALNVRCVEIDPKAVRFLCERFPFGINCVEISEGDFIDQLVSGFDRIVMNPPFSGGQAIQHVRHALDRLSTHGTLVAVMPAGVTTNSDRASKSFRDLVKRCKGEFIELPDDSFKESGTRVRTVAVRIHGRADR